MKWWPRWVGDFAAKTRHLTVLEHGVYTLLLDHYYTTENALPVEVDRLCRIVGARTDDEERAVKRVAAEFFPINGDGTRHNKRADEEIQKSQTKSKSAAEAAGKRWGKRT